MAAPMDWQQNRGNQPNFDNSWGQQASPGPPNMFNSPGSFSNRMPVPNTGVPPSLMEIQQEFTSGHRPPPGSNLNLNQQFQPHRMPYQRRNAGHVRQPNTLNTDYPHQMHQYPPPLAGSNFQQSRFRNPPPLLGELNQEQHSSQPFNFNRSGDDGQCGLESSSGFPQGNVNYDPMKTRNVCGNARQNKWDMAPQLSKQEPGSFQANNPKIRPGHQPLFQQDPQTAMSSNKDSQQQKDDAVWIEKFLRGKSNDKHSDIGKQLKICEAQEKTRHMIILLARLQKHKQLLETMKQEDKSIWDQKLKEVNLIKAELEDLQKQLTTKEAVANLKLRVDQRRKRRERIKRRKQELYQQRQAELAARDRLNAEIDKKMASIQEKEKEAKQERELQKEGDIILGQVRKKLSDAQKTKQLLSGLQKLRKVRRDRLERQGVASMLGGASQATSLMFDTKVDNLSEMMDKQLVRYRAEEDTLKVILETEHEETREKEREKIQEKELEKQRRLQNKEEQMLFGKQKEPRPGDPLYPFSQYYDMASSSLEALVSVRRDWDTYLVMPNTPGASAIPVDWVMPPEPSTEAWESAVCSKS